MHVIFIKATYNGDKRYLYYVYIIILWSALDLLFLVATAAMCPSQGGKFGSGMCSLMAVEGTAFNFEGSLEAVEGTAFNFEGS